MVCKLVVLSWIEHLEQGGARIAPSVTAHLVDLIKKEDRVVGLDLLE